MSQQENDKTKKDFSEQEINRPETIPGEEGNDLKDRKDAGDNDSIKDQVSGSTDKNIGNSSNKNEDQLENAMVQENKSSGNRAESEKMEKDYSDAQRGDSNDKEEKSVPAKAPSEIKEERLEDSAKNETSEEDTSTEESKVETLAHSTVTGSGEGESEKATGEMENSSEEEDEEEETAQAKKDAKTEFEDSVAGDSEDETAGERHGIEKKDYHSMSKEELVAELERLVKNEKIQAIKEHVEEIKAEFNAKFDEELEEKKEEFLAEGGNIIDFHYSTPIKKDFNSIYFDYKEKRNNYYQQLKQDLNKNLNRRQEIIEELKGLLDVEENINTTYKHFKELQEKWRTAGPIPRDKYNTVWNTYHHHVENFYDFLHLNREFRDLDFKHNLEQKLKVIDRAEELTQEEDTSRAFRELQMLHKMWKEELGPVGKEYREDIWNRFSEATKKIHDKRQSYYDQLDQQYETNLEVKQGIIAKIKNLAETQYTAHSQWQQKIKELESLREEFFKAGKVPRDKNEETWSEFKQNVRKFNRNKNAYYKGLKKEQYDNLEKKRELIKIAEDNKDSEDFKATTALMKKIQADWKKIGHVPRKDSDKVWKQFKAACNHYFDRMHKNNSQENEEEVKAFEEKKQILDDLKNLELEGDKKKDLPKIKAAIEQWKNIGRVPYNKRFIEGKFNKQLDQLFSKLDVDNTKAEMMKYENKVQSLNDQDDEKKIRNEHYFLSKKVEETKGEIMQLENNLQFFSNVDADNPLVKEVHKNIENHKEQLEIWKEKLEKIKSLY